MSGLFHEGLCLLAFKIFCSHLFAGVPGAMLYAYFSVPPLLGILYLGANVPADIVLIPLACAFAQRYCGTIHQRVFECYFFNISIDTCAVSTAAVLQALANNSPAGRYHQIDGVVLTKFDTIDTKVLSADSPGTATRVIPVILDRNWAHMHVCNAFIGCVSTWTGTTATFAVAWHRLQLKITPLASLHQLHPRAVALPHIILQRCVAHAHPVPCRTDNVGEAFFQ